MFSPTLVYKAMTDQVLMKQMKAEMKEFQKENLILMIYNLEIIVLV